MSDLESTKQFIQSKVAEILPKVEIVSDQKGSLAKITIRQESISLPIVTNAVINSSIKIR